MWRCDSLEEKKQQFNSSDTVLWVCASFGECIFSVNKLRMENECRNEKKKRKKLNDCWLIDSACQVLFTSEKNDTRPSRKKTNFNFETVAKNYLSRKELTCMCTNGKFVVLNAHTHTDTPNPPPQN